MSPSEPDDAILGRELRPRGPVQFSLSTRRLSDPEATLVTVSGELDLLTAPRLASRVDEVIRRNRGHVVIDLVATKFIDSLGVHTLLTVQRRLARDQRQLTVICPEGPVREALQMSRPAGGPTIVSSLAEYEAQ